MYLVSLTAVRAYFPWTVLFIYRTLIYKSFAPSIKINWKQCDEERWTASNDYLPVSRAKAKRSSGGWPPSRTKLTARPAVSSLPFTELTSGPVVCSPSVITSTWPIDDRAGSEELETLRMLVVGAVLWRSWKINVLILLFVWLAGWLINVLELSFIINYYIEPGSNRPSCTLFRVQICVFRNNSDILKHCQQPSVNLYTASI